MASIRSTLAVDAFKRWTPQYLPAPCLSSSDGSAKQPQLPCQSCTYQVLVAAAGLSTDCAVPCHDA
jgi:hypothetical protein